jgi:hypothetical protein
MPSKRPASKQRNKDRKAGDWIHTYLEFVEHTEPPTAYHRWVAIGCISAALQRRVYFRWGMETIYPNLYIVLLGPSAQTRKSTALRIGEELIKDLSIPIIGQDNSKEAVIREIKKASTSFNDGTFIRTQSAVVCFASELAVFLGRQDSDFQAYLTDWYDAPEKWVRTTKHQGVDDITGLSFTLIGAMAPDWIPHVFTPESIGGGFTSRVMFVTEYKKSKTIANPNAYPPPNGRREKLLADLQTIQSRLVGAYDFSPEAMEFYEYWYTKDDANLQRGEYAVQDRAFYSYCGRRPTMLRKVSMCVSASRSNDQIIELEDIQDALAWMEESEHRMPGTFAAVGRSPQAAAMAAFKQQLAQRGTLLRSTFLRSMSQDMSAADLDEIEKTLEGAKSISVKRLTETNDTEYKWLGD